MATDRQIAANRANSRKSTGPRTPAGKSASRFNSLKSGVYAKSRILPTEDPAEYEALRDGYYRDFAPATTDERELLEDVIANRWKVRRLQAAYDDMWSVAVDWDRKSANHRDDYPLLRPFNGSADSFANLRRELSAAERHVHRARTALLKAQQSRAKSTNLASLPPPAEPLFPRPKSTPPERPGPRSLAPGPFPPTPHPRLERVDNPPATSLL